MCGRRGIQYVPGGHALQLEPRRPGFQPAGSTPPGGRVQRVELPGGDRCGRIGTGDRACRQPQARDCRPFPACRGAWNASTWGRLSPPLSILRTPPMRCKVALEARPADDPWPTGDCGFWLCRAARPRKATHDGRNLCRTGGYIRIDSRRPAHRKSLEDILAEMAAGRGIARAGWRADFLADS